MTYKQTLGSLFSESELPAVYKGLFSNKLCAIYNDKDTSMSLISMIFSCTRCGYCCHGETTVSLDERDRRRMIKTLAIEPDKVKERFWRVTGNIVQMKIEDGHCIFYSNGCRIHNGRPWRCGQWPLHPSILSDENNFHVIAESCPGINQEIGYDKFCEILKKLMAESTVVC